MSETKYRIVKKTYLTRYGETTFYKIQYLKKFLFWTWWEYTYENYGILHDKFDTLEQAQLRIKELKYGIREEIIEDIND